MRFSSGQRLGNYEVVETIGAGGMGEVYRARDLDLERDVAIKVLPESLADDEERIARLEREARLLASLNHPHIAAIHSLEAVEGNRFLVLEVVDGETLQERLGRGPLPPDEAISVARQIAEALEAAHGKGVIHRDLKPANIMLAPEAGVKVLDFGLAKASGQEPSSSQSESPTFTRHTETGVILGTAPYMSPEQARGKPVDKRTDIWGFGCVLYEMLTGRSAFHGEDVSATLAQILEREPDWNALPARMPVSVRRLLTRCLEKDPKRRLRDAGDAILDLDTMEAFPEASPAKADVWWKRLVWGSVGLMIGVVVASWAGSNDSDTATTSRLVRFHTEPISSNRSAPPFALSPDGSRLVYLSERDGTRRLYVRTFERVEAGSIRGTEGARMPFISIDGTSVGFIDSEFSRLSTTSLDGGSPVERVDATPRGASWDSDGSIVFSPDNAGGLSRLEADGNIVVLTELDEQKAELTHRWPDILPGGKAVLFALDYMTTDSWDDAAIAIVELDTGKHRVLIEGGTSPKYVPTGHILFARDGSLLAVPFDLNRLEVTGAPTIVFDGIVTSPLNGSAFYDISDEGTLITMSGGSQPSVRRLVWVDRGGVATPLPVDPLPVMRVDLSPDGASLALDVESARADVWIYAIDRDVMRRLTFEGLNLVLGWSPDGEQLLFHSLMGQSGIFRTHVDGSGPPERIVPIPGRTASLSPDGKTLAYAIPSSNGMNDVWLLSMNGGGEPQAFVQTAFDERMPKFSPDGRWLAYTSDESGQQEVYVAAYPGPGRRWQISTEGGREPLWPPDGTELFYRNVIGDEVMVVELELAPAFRPGRARVLFDGQFSTYAGDDGPTYDIDPDGQRFVMTRDVEPPPVPIEITLNWFTELERLVPVP